MLTALGLWGELFHTAVGTAFADIPPRAIGKPGRYAANGFGVGCGGAITKRRARRRAQRPSARPSIS